MEDAPKSSAGCLVSWMFYRMRTGQPCLRWGIQRCERQLAAHVLSRTAPCLHPLLTPCSHEGVMHNLVQVLAAVFGPHEVKKRSELMEDRAIVKCEYAMAAFSTGAQHVYSMHAMCTSFQLPLRILACMLLYVAHCQVQLAYTFMHETQSTCAQLRYWHTQEFMCGQSQDSVLFPERYQPLATLARLLVCAHQHTAHACTTTAMHTPPHAPPPLLCMCPLGERRRRGKTDRRSTELSMVIRNTLEQAILVDLLPRSQIDVYVQVLQADGGTRCAAINAAILALAGAGIPLRDLFGSCAAGYLDSTPILDMNYLEDAGGGPDVSVALAPNSDKLVLVQMDNRLPIETFERVLEMAKDGCKSVSQFMRSELLAHTQRLAAARGLVSS